MRLKQNVILDPITPISINIKYHLKPRLPKAPTFHQNDKKGCKRYFLDAQIRLLLQFYVTGKNHRRTGNQHQW